MRASHNRGNLCWRKAKVLMRDVLFYPAASAAASPVPRPAIDTADSAQRPQSQRPQGGTAAEILPLQLQPPLGIDREAQAQPILAGGSGRLQRQSQRCSRPAP